jgi:excisionase family DNA binding protein
MGRKVQTEKLSSAAARRESLTTAEAAQLTGYARDHIGLMIRRRAIKAKKRGRDWFVDADSLLTYVSRNPKPGRKRKT